jgi:hypothetical protein
MNGRREDQVFGGRGIRSLGGIHRPTVSAPTRHPKRLGRWGKATIRRGYTVTGAPNDLPTEIRIPSAGARRMALYRERQKGLRCIMIEILDVEINMLIRRGWLARDRRADPVEVRKALHTLLDNALR